MPTSSLKSKRRLWRSTQAKQNGVQSIAICTKCNLEMWFNYHQDSRKCKQCKLRIPFERINIEQLYFDWE